MVIGLFQTEYPWSGEGIIANGAFTLGCGIGSLTFAAIAYVVATAINSSRRLILQAVTKIRR
jgi:hypothetical protein